MYDNYIINFISVGGFNRMNQLLTGFKFNIITIALTVFLIISTIISYFSSKDIQSSCEMKHDLLLNADRFMSASAYLTNEVRAFVSTGYEIHHDNYWNELVSLNNREIAIDEMKEIGVTPEELSIVEEMLNISNSLVVFEVNAIDFIKSQEISEAITTLYGEEYVNEVARLKEQSDTFLHMLQNRTSEVLVANILKGDILHILICFYTLIIIIMQVISFFKNKTLSLDTDIFSGISNRNKYMKVLEQIEKTQVGTVGIVQLDINGLNQINTEFGNKYGDKLILKTVNIMRTCFDDNVFRIGGDDFSALVINKDRSVFDNKLSQLRSVLAMNTDIDVSIGSSWCSDVKEISNQISHVNELMQVDKQSYYREDQSSKKSYRAITATELKDSIASNDFVIMLQPKTRLWDQKVVGAEALVRKKDGKGGFIPPDKFIPVYEADGMIPLLDFYVLEVVCEILKKWEDAGYPLIPISVNFSRKTILEYNVAEKIYDICKKHDISTQLISIELTEHISNISFENLKEILDSIKALGFHISLDDFGREYANLSIISNISFDEIKIDKSLIDDLADNVAVKTTIKCITEMCNAFRPTEMVIEGIETQGQIDELYTLDSRSLIVQGYYFSKPIIEADFLDYYLKANV